MNKNEQLLSDITNTLTALNSKPEQTDEDKELISILKTKRNMILKNME